MRAELLNLAGVNNATQSQKYLGLPTMIGRSKKHIFAGALEKIQRKCKGWKEKYLTKAGREIMVKAVFQAIPTYMMSCFLFPTEVLHEIGMTMARFFWGSKNGEKKIHWMGWDKLAKRKEKGGLGFRNLRCFNLAMLARQYWRLIHNPETITFKILRAKYFPHGEILNAGIGYQPSYLWRSILASREVVNEGMAWRLGNGESIDVVKDKWVGGPPLTRPSWNRLLTNYELKVSDLIDKEHICWKDELVREILADDADRILAMPLSRRMPPDHRVWGVSKDGRFSVRSAYRVAVSLQQIGGESTSAQAASSNLWSQIWRLKLTPKIASFLWQACHEALPTLSNLQRHGMRVDPICHLCGEDVETHSHLFVQCQVTQHLWKVSTLRFHEISSMGSVNSFIGNSLMHYPTEVNQMIALVSWHIWIMRNKQIFDGKQWDVTDILDRIARAWEEMCNVAQRPRQSAGNMKVINEKSWSPPPIGWLKLTST